MISLVVLQVTKTPVKPQTGDNILLIDLDYGMQAEELLEPDYRASDNRPISNSFL